MTDLNVAINLSFTDSIFAYFNMLNTLCGDCQGPVNAGLIVIVNNGWSGNIWKVHIVAAIADAE